MHNSHATDVFGPFLRPIIHIHIYSIVYCVSTYTNFTVTLNRFRNFAVALDKFRNFTVTLDKS